MSDVSTSKPEDTTVPIGMSFAEFLESHPPNQLATISNIKAWHPNSGRPGNYQGLITPEIQLHCPTESCNGVRFFRCISQAPPFTTTQFRYTYLTYRCWNCQKYEKIFSVAARNQESEKGEALKFGELPPFGPPTSARLIKLIGPDRETFLKGRRCENQGLGIGAFIYYRRVVEHQKNRILAQIVKVAERIGASQSMLDVLKRASEETQFSRALEIAKEVIPESLRINGHNPLALLHGALSEGVHEMTDQECLEMAGSIRVVLAELAERIDFALKDEAELQQALAAMLRKHNPS